MSQLGTSIHEIRNALTVAVANVEAFIDGKLAPNHDRLTAVLEALRDVEMLLNDVSAGEPGASSTDSMRTEGDRSSRS